MSNIIFLKTWRQHWYTIVASSIAQVNGSLEDEDLNPAELTFLKKATKWTKLVIFEGFCSYQEHQVDLCYDIFLSDLDPADIPEQYSDPASLSQKLFPLLLSAFPPGFRFESGTMFYTREGV